jgi:hypothetical protein
MGVKTQNGGSYLRSFSFQNWENTCGHFSNFWSLRPRICVAVMGAKSWRCHLDPPKTQEQLVNFRISLCQTCPSFFLSLYPFKEPCSMLTSQRERQMQISLCVLVTTSKRRVLSALAFQFFFFIPVSESGPFNIY